MVMPAKDFRPVFHWNRAKLEQFRKACNEAIFDGKPEFTFEGHPFLVAYAKYLIEYLEGMLPKDNQRV